MSDNKCGGITTAWNLEGNNFLAGSLMMQTSREELLAVGWSAENKYKSVNKVHQFGRLQ
jgi:hypothetical protein